MFKRFLFLFYVFIFLGILPVYCGEFEEAVRTNDKIFLYMYTKDCGYCVKFNPIYNKVSQKFLSYCKFLKIDAYTEYGGSLMRRLNAYYVPYVVMIDNNKRILRTIDLKCMLNYSCTMDAVDKFVK